jgi:hypothetical protein
MLVRRSSCAGGWGDFGSLLASSEKRGTGDDAD